MATTTNYSWTTPDDTALVKDGAAAIRSLGTAIDSTVFSNASAAIAKTIVDAKGDIIAATAADTIARLAVGANDTVLTADSSTATGLKWSAPVSGGMTLLSTTTLSGTTTTISSINQTYNQLFGLIVGPTWDSGADYFLMLPNNSSSIGNVVGVAGYNNNAYTTVENDTFIKFNPQAQQKNTYTQAIYSFTINNYTSTTVNKTISHYSYGQDSSNFNTYSNMGGGIKTTSAITSLRFKTGNDYTFSAGTVLLYGVK
jgi:hypothetical protein